MRRTCSDDRPLNAAQTQEKLHQHSLIVARTGVFRVAVSLAAFMVGAPARTRVTESADLVVVGVVHDPTGGMQSIIRVDAVWSKGRNCDPAVGSMDMLPTIHKHKLQHSRT